MQYMLMIFEDEANYAGGEDSAAFQAIVAAHGALVEQMSAAGVMRGGAGLLPSATATTVRTRNGKVSMHDGPWAETREQLGGFYLIEVDTLDEALAWAQKIPMAADGSIEVRPTIPE
ncbi:MAG: YciI family protein [Ahniella sp.]|nr:YciI family protein [Ahniella sp.]